MPDKKITLAPRYIASLYAVAEQLRNGSIALRDVASQVAKQGGEDYAYADLAEQLESLGKQIKGLAEARRGNREK